MCRCFASIFQLYRPYMITSSHILHPPHVAPLSFLSDRLASDSLGAAVLRRRIVGKTKNHDTKIDFWRVLHYQWFFLAKKARILPHFGETKSSPPEIKGCEARFLLCVIRDRIPSKRNEKRIRR